MDPVKDSPNRTAAGNDKVFGTAGRVFQIRPVTTHRPHKTSLWKKVRVPVIGVIVLVTVYLGLVIAGGGISPRFDDSFSWSGDSLLLFAHRGAASIVPETIR